MFSQRNRGRQNTKSPQYLSPGHSFPTDLSSSYNSAQADLWDPLATARPRAHSAVNSQPHPAAHSTSYDAPIAFPEPQIYRSVSDRRGYPPTVTPSNALSHSHSTHNLRATSLHRGASVSSVSSSASSYYQPGEDQVAEEIYSRDAYGRISDDFNRLTLDADEAVRRFQKGELPDTEEEWHKLVPHEALDALGKQEVQRQSVIFEVIKSERDYVADLRSIQDVFINGLRNAPVPIIRPSRLADFIQEIFINLNEILRLHERMLATLFQRQKEQHPFILCVSDIVLDTVLRDEFRSSYEVYIEHYPLSESHHRKELASNPAYKEFLASVSDDPRIRKRDIITFLSRPVTRLPRLSLLLEQVLKLTDKSHNHPDLESLPTILGILSDFLKSTQPGIAAAESKAKLWDLCERLEYQKGEIIDMDLKDDSRTVFYSGPVVRRTRGETGFSTWTDLTATLLDNYFILTRDVKRGGVIVKQQLMSRPVPLSHLRCASFDAPSESRREKSDEGGILDSLRSQTVDMYPFTIYHASNVLHRRYTLCVISDGLRQRWRSILEEAMGVYRIRQEANMWYYFRTISEGFFRVSGPKSTGTAVTGAPFKSGGRRFIAVGCRAGIFVSTWGTEDFRQVLGLENPTQIAAVHELGGKQFHRLLVHHGNSILSYSLDILALVATRQSQPSTLDASMERVAGQDSNVMFFRLAEIGQRILVMYASKRFLQVTPSLHVLEAVDVTGAVGKRKKKSAIFQPFGESGYVPKDAFDITPLSRSVGIVTRDGIVISDPTNFAKSAVTVVPDLHSSGPGVALLKTRIEGAKPLGLVRAAEGELMIVYDTIGCYITKRGALSRSAGFVKWETQAQSFVYRGNHVLLFSPDFIEVRDVRNGRLVQVMEAIDIRLLYFNPSVGSNDPIILAMKGKRGDKDDFSVKIVELAETVALSPGPQSPLRDMKMAPKAASMLWDEWDITVS